MKKKILISYCGMISGGSTAALVSLLNMIDRDKYDVDLALYRHDFPYMDSIPEGVNLLPQVRQNLSSFKKAFLYLSRGYALKWLWYKLTCKGQQYVNLDFQVREMSEPNSKAYDTAIGFMEGWSDEYALERINAKKHIVWLHIDFSKANSVNLKMEHRYLSKADTIVCVSSACKDALIKLFPDLKPRATYVENIVSKDYILAQIRKAEKDPDEELIKKSKGLKIVTVCRMSIYHKGLDRIVMAAEELKKSGAEFTWFIIGDGNDFEKVKQLIVERNLQDDVILLGFKKQPYTLMCLCDLYCMPSRYEGKPIVVSEAMLLGLPVLVTNYASAEGQIENGVNGVIVANEDNSIVEPLVSFCKNSSLLNEYRMRLAGFSIDYSEVESQIYQILDS